MRVVRAQFNSNRRPQYRTGTRINEDHNGAWIEKYALCPEAQAHVASIPVKAASIQRQYDSVSVDQPQMSDGRIRSSFAHGDSVARLIGDALTKNDRSALYEVIAFFVQTVGAPAKVNEDWWKSHQFYEVFGRVSEEFQRPCLCLSPANIDISVENVLVDSKRNVTIIDVEWVFDFSVPLDYCLWRSVFHNAPKIFSGHSKDMSIAEFASTLGLSSEDFKTFESWERSFLDHVHGERPILEMPRGFAAPKPYKNLDDLIGHLDSSLQLVADLREYTGNLEQENVRLDQEIKKILATSSWKVTAPLRRILSTLRKIRS